MKKLIYTILFALIVSSSITSCTKEEVKPATTGPAGGQASDRGF